MQQGKLNIVIGGQAGSEAKGKLSGYLCSKYKPDLLVMTASPNAGHTVVDGDFKKVSYHLPVGAAMCDAPIVLGPASLINPKIFFQKDILELGIDPARVTVDPRASIITSWNKQDECNAKLTDIGSTMQGIGPCRTSKAMRREDHVFVRNNLLGVNVEETAPIIHEYLREGKLVLCESTQGFDLDLEHGIHPRYCTSKMINTSMILAESGVPPQLVGDVYGVIRPYPIRVNNRSGTSGPYGDSMEITWEDVAGRCGYDGDLTEYTTTTKLPRRVFEFNWSRFLKFVDVCGPTKLCLQFANYLDWSVYGSEVLYPYKVAQFIQDLEYASGVPVTHIGTGPANSQMIRRT